jgi:hypothetical protein
MRFSIAQMLIATAVIGVLLGCALTYDIEMVLAMGVWGSAAYSSVHRTVRCWPTFGFWRRIYWLVITAYCCCLFLVILGLLVFSPWAICQRNARLLQFALRNDVRFSSLQVEYAELKGGPCICIRGHMASQRDVKELREKVMSYQWPGTRDVLWQMKVGPSNSTMEDQEYDPRPGRLSPAPDDSPG